MRGGRLLGAGVACTLALAGAYLAWPDGGPSPYTGRQVLLDGIIPVRERAAAPPGTPLGAGLEVQQGSYLVGEVLPTLYSASDGAPDDGWRAIIAVTEPGPRVFERYIANAQEAGFDPRGRSPNGTFCRTVSASLVCRAVHAEGANEARRWLVFDLLQHGGRPERPSQSRLVIEYHDVGEPPYSPSGLEEVPDDPGNGLSGEAPRGSWPDLAEEGEPFRTARPGEPFTVVDGTRLVLPTVTGDTCCDLGFTNTLTLFEVVGDPQAVIGDFLAQSEVQERTFERVQGGVRQLSASWSDGGSYTIQIWVQPGRPTWALLTANPTD